MSLYVVECEPDPWVNGLSLVQQYVPQRWRWQPSIIPTFEVRDCNGRDGEWHATITLPHEVVEHEGLAVPAFEGDTERIAWERARR